MGPGGGAGDDLGRGSFRVSGSSRKLPLLPQVFDYPEDYELRRIGPATLYAETGQREKALQVAERLVQAGNYSRLASQDVYVFRDLLGGDPRYQALPAEAGITW